jgi:radical SAM superfamily enzyme YgiQ (UPF0313 family)
MTDVLLIVPPFTYGPLKEAGPVCPHLGVAIIASMLEKENYDVKLVDGFALNYSMDDIRRKIKKESPSVVGVTSVTANFPNANKVLKITKEIDEDITAVLGGPHITIMPETTTKDTDFLVIGEGDLTAIELINYIIKGVGRKSKIKGIGYWENRKIKLTKPRPIIENLNKLPMPAYHLLPIEKYRSYGTLDLGRRFISIITSRGCPFRCTYCTSSTFWGHRWRAIAPEKVIEQMKTLYENYKVTHFYFQDDEFTINHDRTMKICDMIIENGMDIVWECLARVDHINESLIKKMAKSGCKRIIYGIECGYQEGIEKIKKKITLQQAREAIKISMKYGILVGASFMMGFPWEGQEEVRKTINFAKSLNADTIYFNILTPYPGTEIYEEIKKKKLIVPHDWTQYASHGIMPIMRTEKLTSKEIAYWNGRAYFETYFNPSFLIRKLTHIKGLTQLKRNTAAGVGLFKVALKRYISKIS